jgi:Pyridoxamine 5'-phosphate oxidase
MNRGALAGISVLTLRHAVMSWQALANAAPELAAFGAERLHDQVAYLATLKVDGSPRLHPVRPVVTDGRLFVFMEVTSPKVADLDRDPRYALHGTATSETPWDLQEFVVEGAARRVDDPDRRSTANAGSTFPRDELFVLYELDVGSALSTTYGADGRPRRQRWRAT